MTSNVSDPFQALHHWPYFTVTELVSVRIGTGYRIWDQHPSAEMTRIPRWWRQSINQAWCHAPCPTQGRPHEAGPWQSASRAFYLNICARMALS